MLTANQKQKLHFLIDDKNSAAISSARTILEQEELGAKVKESTAKSENVAVVAAEAYNVLNSMIDDLEITKEMLETCSNYSDSNKVEEIKFKMNSALEKLRNMLARLSIIGPEVAKWEGGDSEAINLT